MPSNERVRLHDRQESTPVDEPRQRNERNSGRVIGPPRLDLPLEVQRQLLAQKQILGASWACGRNVDDTNRRTSPATRTIVWTSRRERNWAMLRDVTAAAARPN